MEQYEVSFSKAPSNAPDYMANKWFWTEESGQCVGYFETEEKARQAYEAQRKL